MKSIRFGRAGCIMAAMLAVSACASVPPEQLAAAKAQVAPSAALPPALRNSIVEVIMKLDAGTWLFGKPTYEYARISDLMFSRPIGAVLTGTTEVNPYYCVELGKGYFSKTAYIIHVQRTSETGYHLKAEKKLRSRICTVTNGQDFPELLARKNAPGDS